MYAFLFFIGMLLCMGSFGYFMLGLMHLEPLWTSAPLFFLSIFFTLHCYNHKRLRRKPNDSK